VSLAGLGPDATRIRVYVVPNRKALLPLTTTYLGDLGAALRVGT
jgi:hypothetical protein